MKGPLGYGRYNDDPKHIGCPRTKSDMTPCIARDGHTALADDNRCVGCGSDPLGALIALKRELGLTPPVVAMGGAHHADQLQKIVRRATEGLSRRRESEDG